MNDLTQAVSEFLRLQRVAVVGVSRSGDQPANLIFRKLKAGQRQVFAVNPNAETVEGETCYPTVMAIPGGVDGAVIVTTPKVACEVIDTCATAGVKNVWLHRSFGEGSVSQEAIERCRARGLRAIPGMCPMMFCDPVDPGHKCMRWMLRLLGKQPAPLSP